MNNENMGNANLENGGGEGESVETISIPKADYDKLNQTLGSLKRENKDLKKPKESQDTPTKETKTEEFGLAHKSFLRAAGISHPEDMELARLTAKKWGVELDQVVDDEDFKIKLERQQNNRTNALATSNIKGNSGSNNAKLTPEYWASKGVPPTSVDVPDRKTRVKIINAMLQNGGSGKKFYND